MLRSIADAGKGMYYYVETVDQIPLSFADCIGGLQSVVAQNIVVNLHARNGAVIQKILNTGYKVSGNLPGPSVSLTVGDLYTEETRDLLFRVELPALAQPSEHFEFCDFSLEYFSLLHTRDEKQETKGTIERPQEGQKCQRNEEVDKQFNRITTAQAIEQGRIYADAGDFERAKEVFTSAKVQCQSSPTAFDSYTHALMSDLEEAEQNSASVDAYQNGGKFKMFSKAQSHNMQRANCSAPMSSYETKAKAKKKGFFS